MHLQNFIQRHLLKRSVVSCLLWPLSLPYALILQLRRTLYRLAPIAFRAPVRIISIGNIVSGGTGKTPFTIYLARKLTAEGKQVAISHRGYKGDFENDNRLISNRSEVLPCARNAGDEALLMTEKLSGIPVVVGRNRRKSIELLLHEFPDLDAIILDDSFQHLRVHHDEDYLLFQAGTGIGNGWILPAGVLREPLAALRDATTIVWNGSDDIPAYLQNSGKPIIKGSYHVEGLFDIQGNLIPSESLSHTPCALLSGIGYPGGFEKTVRSLGISFQHHFRLPDHNRYEDSQLQHISAQCLTLGIHALITTEKDFVKLRNFHNDLRILTLRIVFQPH